jgi:FkbM family methyltransferase
MSITNKLIHFIDKPLTRELLKQLIYFGYKRKGIHIEKVKFHKDFGAWEFRIDGISYLSTGPGWVYCHDYLLKQLKSLAGYFYTPKQGDVVFDLGAGVGEETIILSQLVGERGKVYSIEAHSKTYKALSYLVSVNQLSNVVAENLAFAEMSGFIEIEDSGNSLANTILPISKQKSFKVKAITFDEYVMKNSIASIDFVKMNIEGAEQLVIQGMSQSMPIIKHLAISCHDFRYKSGESEFFKTKDIVIQFLRDNNFYVKSQLTTVDMVDDFVYAVNLRLVP